MRFVAAFSSSRTPRRAKMARMRCRAATAWPDRISPLVASVTATSAPRATWRRRWSMASASSTPPAPPPITAIRSAPCQSLTRSRKPSQRCPSSAMGFTGVACSAAPGIASMLGEEPTSSDTRS